MGRIRLEGAQTGLTGAIDLPPHRGALPFVGPPPEKTSLRVVSVAGASVPTNPEADFASPDVAIDDAGPVTLQIEATNIALGTVVTVVVISDSSADVVVDSTPLAGTLLQSTATATLNMPPGYSRVYLRVK